MAIEGFKPTIWSDRLIVNTDRQFVFGEVANTEYEGEIRGYGDIIKINEIGDITVSDYTSTGMSWEPISDAQKELVIDQKKKFSFYVDDVNAAQAKPKVMDGAMRKASYAIAKNVDEYLASKYDEAGITNATNLGSSGTSLTVNANDMLELLTYMHLYLDENDAGPDRWVAWPPWCVQYLKYSEIVQNSAGTIDNPNSPALQNGMLGFSLGFSHYMSNSVSNNGTQYRIMFGTRDALAFAGQVEKIEAIRREDYFHDGVKGLWVYGAKVVRPDHLGTAYLAAGGLTS